MKRVLLPSIVLGLVIGLIGALVVFNYQQQSLDRQLEVTFLSPRQALVFWKSEVPTLGYVRHGAQPFWRNSTEYQTSSEPGVIHAVMLDEVPLEGLHISVHTEADSPFYWSKVQKIQYEGSRDE